MGRPPGAKNKATRKSSPGRRRSTTSKQGGVGTRVREIALKLLKKHPEGIRYTQLVRQIIERDQTLEKSARTEAASLDVKIPDQIYKPERGLYRLIEFRDARAGPARGKAVKETQFYQPFADFLVNDLEECTNAIELGGNLFKDKWGTPDVIGIRKATPGDIIQQPTEVVSAEIKSNTNEIITAFGQACAYSVFSHRTYLVIPKDSPPEEISKIDSLCQGFGIGLILFDSTSPLNPGFDILVRARKLEPDLFYTNKNLKFVVEKYKNFL